MYVRIYVSMYISMNTCLISRRKVLSEPSDSTLPHSPSLHSSTMKAIFFIVFGAFLCLSGEAMQGSSKPLSIAKGSFKPQRTPDDDRLDAQLDEEENEKAEFKRQAHAEAADEMAQASILNMASSSAGRNEGEQAVLCLSTKRKSSDDTDDLANKAARVSQQPNVSNTRPQNLPTPKLQNMTGMPGVTSRPLLIAAFKQMKFKANAIAATTASPAAPPVPPAAAIEPPAAPSTPAPPTYIRAKPKSGEETLLWTCFSAGPPRGSKGAMVRDIKCLVHNCSTQFEEKMRDQKKRERHIRDHGYLWSNFTKASPAEVLQFKTTGKVPEPAKTKTEPQSQTKIFGMQYLDTSSPQHEELCAAWARHHGVCKLKPFGTQSQTILPAHGPGGMGIRIECRYIVLTMAHEGF